MSYDIAPLLNAVTIFCPCLSFEVDVVHDFGFMTSPARQVLCAVRLGRVTDSVDVFDGNETSFLQNAQDDAALLCHF